MAASILAEPAADAVIAGERRALTQAIALIESARAADRARGEELLETLLPHAGKSIRLGISGSPGTGKASFIQAFGLHLLNRGRKLAVLAVDPAVPHPGGGPRSDAPRMEELAKDQRVFIHPSPVGGTLGGLARRTREAMLACEAAGFDTIIIETADVGQAEVAVADMVDMFMLLLAPGEGDAQGIRRGIVELADAIIVTKRDGELFSAASVLAADYRAALHLLRPSAEGWTVPVLTCSAAKRTGIEPIWSTVLRHHQVTTDSGALAARRAAQAEAWLWSALREGLMDRFKAHAGMNAALASAEAEVEAGQVTPSAAAQALLDRFAK